MGQALEPREERHQAARAGGGLVDEAERLRAQVPVSSDDTDVVRPRHRLRQFVEEGGVGEERLREKDEDEAANHLRIEIEVVLLKILAHTSYSLDRICAWSQS